MKKSLLVCAFVFTSFISAKGQTSENLYQKGKIYIKVNNDIPIVSSSLKNDDPNNLKLSTLSFLSSYTRIYSIINLKKPFLTATDSKDLLSIYELTISNDQLVEQLINQLKREKGVEYAERVPSNQHCFTPNDPNYPSQWELTKINAASAWGYSKGKSSITIAIVDDGVELTHPDLSPSIWTNTAEIVNNGIDDDNNGYIDDVNGYDVADNDKDPNPPNNTFYHGTGVASCAAAKTNNSIGMSSLAFTCKIMPVKGYSSFSINDNLYAGIIYAAINKANVINCSWGSAAFSTTNQTVVDYAYNKGCILVAGVGNSSVNSLFYPAALNHVISVGATDASDQMTIFSNYGTWIDCVAPGLNITVAKNGSYSTLSGTSFSSPIVASLCGLMLSYNPGLTQSEVESCLKSTCTNIDALNPTYVGQMGAGRIDALAALQCLTPTLTLKPTTNFYANSLGGPAGTIITFTDSTIHGATTWAWTFTGGTPSTYNGKTPPKITYSTPGVYNVSLTTSNANGSDTKTKTNYITITTGGGCGIANYGYVTGGAWTAQVYSIDDMSGNNFGYFPGKNSQDTAVEFGQFIDLSTSPYDTLSNFNLFVFKAYSTNMNKQLTFRVYDATANTLPPPAPLATVTRTMQDCKNAINGGKYLNVFFHNGVKLPASKRIYITIDVSNLTWDNTTKDTLMIVGNTSGQTSPSTVIMKKASGKWGQLGSTGTSGFWTFDISLFLFPYITNTPTHAKFTTSATTICSGGSVDFNAAGSTSENGLLWAFPGSTASSNISSLSPSAIYNTAGTYDAKFYVIGGACGQYDTAYTTVTVKPTPTITISPSGSATVCQGNSIALTASGNSTYTWSPSTGLNTTSGAAVNANPTSDIQYNVSGTLNGCTGTASVDVKVEKPIVLNVTNTPNNSTFCVNQNILFNASLSTNVTNYSWSFIGANNTSSILASAQIKYASAGTYTVTLNTSNSCFSDNSYSKVVTVPGVCTGIQDFFSNDNINCLYDRSDNTVTIQFVNSNDQFKDMNLIIVDALGQILQNSQIKSINGSNNKFNLGNISSGIILITLFNENGKYAKRIPIY